MLPLVALAAGSLLGGVLFHMLPGSDTALGNSLTVYVWLAAGLVGFLVPEQVLHCTTATGHWSRVTACPSSLSL